MKKVKFNPADFSTAPETFRVERIFNNSPKQIWTELIKHEDMVDWMPGIKSVKVVHNQEGEAGLGSKRVCQFGSEQLHEEIVNWEVNKTYAYKIADNKLIKNHVAYVTIQELGHNKSKVSWIQHLEPQGNLIKQFLMKNVMLPRTLKKALENLEKRIAA